MIFGVLIMEKGVGRNAECSGVKSRIFLKSVCVVRRYTVSIRIRGDFDVVKNYLIYAQLTQYI